jgi:iron complex transport system ATP-binding protein
MMLSGRGLAYRVAGRVLLSDVDICVDRGELVALVGPNGAGKSTLLGLLAGDLEPYDGAVSIDGTPVRGRRVHELARLRAVMPQQTLLQFAFTVAEVVALGAHVAVRTHVSDVVESALARVDGTDLAARTFPTLSGGEQARVTLARVIAQRTPVLLLDEPCAHLDLRHQDLVLRLARALADDGHTVVVVLHDVNLAARWADRVAVLADGRMVACGPPARALTSTTLSEVYQHPVTVIEHPLHGCPLALVGS